MESIFSKEMQKGIVIIDGGRDLSEFFIIRSGIGSKFKLRQLYVPNWRIRSFTPYAGSDFFYHFGADLRHLGCILYGLRSVREGCCSPVVLIEPHGHQRGSSESAETTDLFWMLNLSSEIF
jgi:hypothetical protein